MTALGKGWRGMGFTSREGSSGWLALQSAAYIISLPPPPLFASAFSLSLSGSPTPKSFYLEALVTIGRLSYKDHCWYEFYSHLATFVHNSNVSTSREQDRDQISPSTPPTSVASLEGGQDPSTQLDDSNTARLRRSRSSSVHEKNLYPTSDISSPYRSTSKYTANTSTYNTSRPPLINNGYYKYIKPAPFTRESIRNLYNNKEAEADDGEEGSQR